MITKEELKKEVDKLPESLLDEVYSLLKRITKHKKAGMKDDWNGWKNNLEKFTPDFMSIREQPIQPLRESLD